MNRIALIFENLDTQGGSCVSGITIFENLDTQATPYVYQIAIYKKPRYTRKVMIVFKYVIKIDDV